MDDECHFASRIYVHCAYGINEMFPFNGKIIIIYSDKSHKSIFTFEPSKWIHIYNILELFLLFANQNLMRNVTIFNELCTFHLSHSILVAHVLCMQCFHATKLNVGIECATLTEGDKNTTLLHQLQHHAKRIFVSHRDHGSWQHRDNMYNFANMCIRWVYVEYTLSFARNFHSTFRHGTTQHTRHNIWLFRLLLNWSKTSFLRLFGTKNHVSKFQFSVDVENRASHKCKCITIPAPVVSIQPVPNSPSGRNYFIHFYAFMSANFSISLGLFFNSME